MAMASSSSGSTETKTTKITAEKDKKDTDNSEAGDEEKENEGSEDTEDKGEMSYEITDTHFEHHKNILDMEEYFGYVEITNTGTKNIYMKDATFDLEDDDGHLLQSDSGYGSPTVVKPGEKGYFYHSGSFDDGVSLKKGVNLVPSVKVEEATGDFTEYEVVDTDIKKDTLGPKITGRIVNDTDEDVSVVISVVLYDKAGKVIGLYDSSVYDVTAGGKTSFDRTMAFLNADITIKDIADYKVIARSDYYQF